jgi:hypothetical protein
MEWLIILIPELQMQRFAKYPPAIFTRKLKV